MIRNKRGITLIALIITIVVLLILAGVVINLTMGDNGIIGKVQTAVGKYENAQEKENSALAGYENEINSYINENRDYETEINLLKTKISELESDFIDISQECNVLPANGTTTTVSNITTKKIKYKKIGNLYLLPYNNFHIMISNKLTTRCNT